MFCLLMSANVVPSANARWTWRSSGMTGRGKPDVVNKIVKMQRVLLINAEYFDLLHYLRHKNTQEGSDMVDQVFIQWGFYYAGMRNACRHGESHWTCNYAVFCMEEFGPSAGPTGRPRVRSGYSDCNPIPVSNPSYSDHESSWEQDWWGTTPMG